MGSFCVYTITNQLNGKVYVGMSHAPEKRWKRHLAVARYGPSYDRRQYHLIHRALAKYGPDNFAFEVIAEYDDYDECCRAEIDFIAQYRSMEREYGYNLAAGGKGGCLGYHHTPETRRRISEAKKGRTGPLAPTWGRRWTPETKKLMSQKAKERLKDPKNRHMLGRKHTAEARAKMSQNCYRSKPSLSEATVIEARRLYATGKFTHAQLAEQMGISLPLLKKAVRGKEVYAHIGEQLPRDRFGKVRRPAFAHKCMKGLSPDDVAELRRAKRRGACRHVLARERGVDVSVIDSAIHGRCSYQNIECDEPPVEFVSRVLDEAQIEELRRLYETGWYSYEKLGEEFGVSKRAARAAVLGIGRYSKVGTPVSQTLTKREAAERRKVNKHPKRRRGSR